MKTINYLNLEIGRTSKRTTIVNTALRMPKKGSRKLYLKTKADDGKAYTINEVWINGPNGERTTRGLWIDTDINGKIRAGSELHRLLKFMGVGTIADLVNKEITVEPKDNGFMCVVLE